jgi:type IV pilus assembly protein PilV
MMRTKRIANRRLQRGAMMVEVLVSVMLLSVSILGLVRVLGQAVKDSGDLEYRSVASTMADETIGRMWVDRSNLAAYETAMPEALSQLPNGTRTIGVNGNIVTVTIQWQAPGAASASQYEVTATLAGNT